MCGTSLEEKINNLSEKQTKFILINLSKSYYDTISIIVNGIEKDNRNNLNKLDRSHMTNRRRLFS